MSNRDSLKTAVRLSVLILSSLFSLMPGSVAGQSASAPVSSQVKQPPKNSAMAWHQDFYEDWHSLTLDTSSLQPLTPIGGDKVDLPENKFTREHFFVSWRPADSFDLYVALPKGVKKPPVVLYLYSYPEAAARFMNDPWTTSTTNGGFAAVGFASALTAERIRGGRSMKEWFVSELHESLVITVHDVQMILNYLASRGDLDMDHVGMFGVGSGGAIAILASVADPRIKAIDVIDPWGDWPDWLAKSSIVPQDQRAKFLSPEFMKGVAPFDPLQWFPKVQARSVRIQSIQSESTVPEEVQKKMEAAAPDSAEIFQFGDYKAIASVQPGAGVFDWLKLVLQPDSKYQPDPDKSKRVHFYPALGKKFDPAQTHP